MNAIEAVFSPGARLKLALRSMNWMPVEVLAADQNAEKNVRSR